MSIAHVTVEKQFPDESIERMLGRFRSKVKRAGILQDVRKNEFYEKPAVERRRKKVNRKHQSGGKQSN